jgi:hypothetical protein
MQDLYLIWNWNLHLILRNPLFSITKELLDDANSFVLTDAVVIKQTIKPTPKAIETPIVALPSIPLKKRIIIATDTAKVR